MATEIINFQLEKNAGSIIKVIGVGGGGGNAVNHMFRQGIRDVDFIICNTDNQALANSPIPIKIQLGSSLTEGRGAGNKPEVGEQSANENIEDVIRVIRENTKMVFITAGMGGGTGTGAAPVIAKACHELGILTVAIVTIPFRNEGKRRINQAIEGIAKLEDNVDSLLVINNERIREMYGDFPISEAFAKADNVLTTAAKGIAEIITVPGYINVDFADVETVMRKSGVALMGTGIAEGEGRSLAAVEAALNSPLLNNNDINGARNILLNVTSGNDEITMDEIGLISDFVQDKAGFDADLIWGNGVDETLGDRISVTVIATGFSMSSIPEMLAAHKVEKQVHSLNDSEAVLPPKPPKKEPPRQEMKVEIKTEPKRDFKNEAKTLYKREVNPESKPEPKPKPAPQTSQKAFEFDKNLQKKPGSEFDALYPRTNKERNDPGEKERMKVDFSKLSEEEIEEMENIPAYQRKQLRVRGLKDRNRPDMSRYSVAPGEEKNQVYFKDNNPYLHKKVD